VLRLGFDGRALASPAAGVRRYAHELLRGLASLGQPLQLVMLGGARSSAVPPGTEWVPEPPHPPTNAGWMLVGLPWAMRRGRVDLVHAPAYTAPFYAPAPIVLTIHDVSYARRPEWFPYRRDGLRRAFYRRSALSARLVITDSEFSASEIQAAYGIPRSRIAVIPLGVDPAFLTATGARDLPAGIDGPFVLHVGDLHERRNLPMVVQALLEVRQQGGALAKMALVLAGVDRGVGDALTQAARAAGADDLIVLLGRVDDAMLRTLYRRATALVYPSLYEGFGLPLLEAMAGGTPVLASRAASIPEVVGDAGLLLAPRSTAEWAQAIIRVATEDGLAARLRAAGQARASTFSWTRTAEQTLDVYRRALANTALDG
jgi:glycosyltransferase involved in cell wall biosynthesis